MPVACVPGLGFILGPLGAPKHRQEQSEPPVFTVGVMRASGQIALRPQALHPNTGRPALHIREWLHSHPPKLHFVRGACVWNLPPSHQSSWQLFGKLQCVVLPLDVSLGVSYYLMSNKPEQVSLIV